MRGSVLRRLLLGVIVALAVSTPARADTVTDWNALASAALQGPAAQGGAGQGATSFVHLAMVHGAIYDAVNAIDGGRYGSYLTQPPAARWYSKDAAVATA